MTEDKEEKVSLFLKTSLETLEKGEFNHPDPNVVELVNFLWGCVLTGDNH